MRQYPPFTPPVPPNSVTESEVLSGVRSICRYLHIGHETFYRWTTQERFPAAFSPDCRWLTSTTLIDEWILARVEAQQRALHADATDEAETTDAL